MAGRARNPYFPFYPADYMEATRKMTLEQRGAYMDVICLQMMNEGRVEDDERLMAAALVISTRKWRTIRQQLSDAGKISFRDGLIIQERCLRELDELLTKRKNVAEAAAIRERSKRDSAPAQPRTNSEPTPNQLRTNSENSDKSLEIKDLRSTVVPLRARVSDSDTEEERKNPPFVPQEGGEKNGGRMAGIGLAAAAVAASIIAASPVAADATAKPAAQPSLFGEAQPPKPKPVRGRGSKTLLPENWTLPAEWRSVVKEKFNVTDAQIDRQADRFKRWWLSPDSRNRLKADWRMTWINWIDKAQSEGRLGPSGVSATLARFDAIYEGVL